MKGDGSSCFCKQSSDVRQLWNICQCFLQKIFLQLDHNFFILGANTKIKIQVGNVGAHEHQVTSLKFRDVISDVPRAIRVSDKNQFILRMIVPIEKLIQSRIF